MKPRKNELALPAAHRRLLSALAASLPRAELYLVGGTIRDAFLKRSVTDLDLLISGMPAKQLEQALRQLGKVHRIGERFGVLRLVAPGFKGHVDVALPRTEQGRGTGGYRDFSFKPNAFLPVEKDLARRDFTVNAMAYDWRGKSLLDPFDGKADLEKKMLRAVGDPQGRFKEDYSRLLRLLRFAVQLDFRIDASTARAARKLLPRLLAKRDGRFIVPREVVAEQFLRAFLNDPVRTFDLWDDFGAFKILLPEIEALKNCPQGREFHSEGNVFRHTQLALQMLASPRFKRAFPSADPAAVTLLATLLHDIGKPSSIIVQRERGKKKIHFHGHDRIGAEMARAAAERLKLSSYEGLASTDELVWLIRHHLIATKETVHAMRPATLKKYCTGDTGLRLMQLIWADQMASLRPNGQPAIEHFRVLQKRVKKLFRKKKGVLVAPLPLLRGRDLLEVLHIKEGPIVGKILREAEARQLDGELRTRRDALAWARRSVRAFGKAQRS